MASPARDWSQALAKVSREHVCRVCKNGPGEGGVFSLQAAHVIGRAHDRFDLDRGVRVVRAVDTVPLCLRADGGCHGAFDAHRLDLLPHLTLEEQAAAVAHVGIVSAYRRTTSESPVEQWAREGLGG